MRKLYIGFLKEGETTGGDPEATGRRVGKALKRAPAKRTGGMLKKAAKIQSRLEVRRMRKGFPTKGEFNKGLLSGVDENETPEEKAQGEKEVREVLHSLARKDRGRTLLANRKSSEMATKHNKEDRITKILKDKRKLKTENKALYIGFLLDEGKESQLKDTKKKKTNISSISEDESSYNQSNLVKIPYLDWLYEDLSKGYSNTKGVKKLTKIKKVKKAV